MHGLGLYIYAGEDIPQITTDEIAKLNQEKKSGKQVVDDKNWADIVENAKKLKERKLKWDTILQRLMTKYIVDMEQIQRLQKELYGK